MAVKLKLDGCERVAAGRRVEMRGGKSGVLAWVTMVMSVANSDTGAADVRDVVAMWRGPFGSTEQWWE